MELMEVILQRILKTDGYEDRSKTEGCEDREVVKEERNSRKLGYVGTGGKRVQLNALTSVLYNQQGVNERISK